MLRIFQHIDYFYKSISHFCSMGIRVTEFLTQSARKLPEDVGQIGLDGWPVPQVSYLVRADNLTKQSCLDPRNHLEQG